MTSPFFLLVKICDVENRGTVRVALYTKAGERVRDVSFSFGAEGKFYQYITCYERFTQVPAGTYRIAVFVNQHLRDERPLKVDDANSG